ncbi:15256_t:CDS:2, partial [Acaulospora morrowiae]
TTEEKLRSYGMKDGPASRIAEFTKEVKDKKLRAFSPFVSLKEKISTSYIKSHAKRIRHGSTPFSSPHRHRRNWKRIKYAPQHDYAIKDLEDLLRIIEDKQHKVPLGFAQPDALPSRLGGCFDWRCPTPFLSLATFLTLDISSLLKAEATFLHFPTYEVNFDK